MDQTFLFWIIAALATFIVGAAKGGLPATHRLAVPMGPQTIHELETADGQRVKLIEPRHGSPREPGGSVRLGLRRGAEASVFPGSRQ